MAHNRDLYPEIWAEFEKAQAALAPLVKKRQKNLDKMNAVADEMEVLRQKKLQANDAAMADFGAIKELRDKIGRMAKAMGARSA